MPRDVKMETVQRYFGMVDVNKQLLFNATTVEQQERAINFQKHLDNILKGPLCAKNPNSHIKVYLKAYITDYVYYIKLIFKNQI